MTKASHNIDTITQLNNIKYSMQFKANVILRIDTVCEQNGQDESSG